MDKRLIDIGPISRKTLKNIGMGWFATGENEEYLAEEIICLSDRELRPLQEAATSLYDLMIRAVREVASRNLWADMGIPPQAVELVKYSIENEMGMHLISRFDFAGGLDSMPIKMLELNADTCSLMAETHFIQGKHLEQERKKLPNGQPFNALMDGLVDQFKKILQLNPDKEPALLLSTLGYQEDWLNTSVITMAARKAGFQDVQEMNMDKIIFSEEEGIFIELGKDQFIRYDFWFKFVPWELIVFDEPELLETLDHIIRNKLAVVINPAYTMLLQSKALMKVMYDLEPYNPFLLKTSLSAKDFYDHRFVRKPIFGRMGENIAYHNGSSSPEYETDGDYGEFDPVYQELAMFNMDRELHRYQPSIFWTGKPSALCFRRQDDPVLDDDAEFLGHIIT
ncbi:MAG: glutathionylspermidine synthase family protein [Saprospiraceae bacterium]